MMKPVKSLSGSDKQNINWIMIAVLVLVAYSAITATYQLVRRPARVAYVNSGDILKRYKGAIEAAQKFEEESKKWENNIKSLQAEVDSINFLFVKEGDHWSTGKKKEVAGYAQKKDGDLQRYTQAVQQKAAARQQELMQPILADVNNIISEYAQSSGYDIVLGTTDGNIVYAADATNITEDVLKVLNK